MTSLQHTVCQYVTMQQYSYGNIDCWVTIHRIQRIETFLYSA